MRTTILLNCYECKNNFNKNNSEYNRRIYKGSDKFFCSIECYKIYIRKYPNIPEKFDSHCRSAENLKHLQRLRDKRSELTKYPEFKEHLHRVAERIKDKNRKGYTNWDNILSTEDLHNQWISQKGVCPYTGVELILSNKVGDNIICHASLDRIDSSKGYEKDNIHFISVMANFAKHTYSHETMLEFCQTIANHINNKTI